jgi:hypothetical protein
MVSLIAYRPMDVENTEKTVSIHGALDPAQFMLEYLLFSTVPLVSDV